MSRGGEMVGPVPGPAIDPPRLALMLHRHVKRPDPFNDKVEPLIERLLSHGLTILRGYDRLGSAAGGEGG